jgi:hypothetical protein
MRKTMSLKQLAANRRNAQKSTGPKTLNGRAISKMNALKHGILSAAVVVRGKCIKESDKELTAIRRRFWKDWNPIGATEEMLVDKIVTTLWRLSRVLRAESGEIALSVDGGHWNRRCKGNDNTIMAWARERDPVSLMIQSAIGNDFLANELKALRALVEKEGILTEAAIQSVMISAEANSVTKDLEKLRSRLEQNPDGLDESALRAKHKEQVLAYIDSKQWLFSLFKYDCEQREKMEEEEQQAAAVLPSIQVLDKIMRYGTMLQRELSRDMILLERLQRRRLGEAVPPPVIGLLGRF